MVDIGGYGVQVNQIVGSGGSGGSGSSNEETFTNTIDGTLGYRDITIEDGDDKQVCALTIIGDPSATLTLGADITSNTNLRVYSSLQTNDPGTAFSVSIKPS